MKADTQLLLSLIGFPLAVIIALVLIFVGVGVFTQPRSRCAACRQPFINGDRVVTDAESGRQAHLTCPAARGLR